MTRELKSRLTPDIAAVETVLDGLLSTAAADGESERPQRLVSAMRHATLSGGKRLRPILVIETARAFGRSDGGVVQAAAALELVHCYSLAHDDLPAMDDDDIRHGKPTVHRAFDEATAILAGDALLTLAFDAVVAEMVHPDPAVRLALVRALARAAGVGGMAGGQMLDLLAEQGGRAEDHIRRLQAMKTGALIRFACQAGAMLADAGDSEIERLTCFGATIGLAFQLADDLLDVEGDPVELGKAAQKDAAAGKATLVALKGVNGTKAELRRLVSDADDLLDPLGERAATLRAIAHFVAERRR